MKKYFLILCLFISAISFSQIGPKPKTEPKDSITDKTIFYITVDDINRYADKLKDQLTQRQWESFAIGLQAIINNMIAEKKNKPTKP